MRDCGPGIPPAARVNAGAAGIPAALDEDSQPR